MERQLLRASSATRMPATPTGTSAGREARDAALAKTIVEAVAREMAKAHIHHQALLNEKSTAGMPTQEFKSEGGLTIICVLLSLACNVPQSHLFLPGLRIKHGSLIPEASMIPLCQPDTSRTYIKGIYHPKDGFYLVIFSNSCCVNSL